MSYELRILRTLYEEILHDLDRPHDLAYERVGFLYVRRNEKGGKQILGFEYHSIRDDGYMPADDVGARFQGAVIRETMQAILDRDVGILHVHRHDHSGRPSFSRVDLRSLCELLPAFHSVGPHEPHGALLLSNTDMRAVVWDVGLKKLTLVEKISTVGFPMALSIENEIYKERK